MKGVCVCVKEQVELLLNRLPSIKSNRRTSENCPWLSIIILQFIRSMEKRRGRNAGSVETLIIASQPRPAVQRRGVLSIVHQTDRKTEAIASLFLNPSFTGHDVATAFTFLRVRLAVSSFIIWLKLSLFYKQICFIKQFWPSHGWSRLTERWLWSCRRCGCYGCCRCCCCRCCCRSCWYHRSCWCCRRSCRSFRSGWCGWQAGCSAGGRQFRTILVVTFRTVGNAIASGNFANITARIPARVGDITTTINCFYDFLRALSRYCYLKLKFH